MKVKKTRFKSKNTKEIKADISFVKSNISDLHKAVIAHLYNFFKFLNQTHSKHNSKDANISPIYHANIFAINISY